MAYGVGAAVGGGTWWQDLGAEGQEQFRQDNPGKVGSGAGEDYEEDPGSSIMYHNGVPVSGVWEPGNMEDRAKYDPKGAVQLIGQQSDFDVWKIQSGYADGIDPSTGKEREYGGWSAWQLFHQVQRAGGTANSYDPFSGWEDGAGPGNSGAGPVTASDSANVRADMQNAFYAALRVAGMDKKLIDDLWEWAEDELIADPSFTAERALIGMYDSEAFRTRFTAIAEMTDAGYGRRDMPTPGEYIAFEKDVANELKRVGVVDHGAGTFDKLINSLYMNSVGLQEVTNRLNTAQRVMYEMPQAVRDTLTGWVSEEYGTSIAMKTFLDPTDEWSQVQDDISTAQTGGWGKMVAGLDAGWDKDLAKQVSDLGMSQAEQWSRFADLKEREMLFSETLNEKVDLDYEEHGVKSAFDMDADISDTLTRRAAERSAAFRGGGGAMVLEATTGFGAANA